MKPSQLRGAVIAACIAGASTVSSAGFVGTRALFNDATSNRQLESFEGIEEFSGAPLNLPFDDGLAPVAGLVATIDSGSFGGVASNSAAYEAVGRRATNGEKFWNTGFNVGINFLSPVGAFGFDWVDLGDFQTEQCTLTNPDDCPTTSGLIVKIFYADAGGPPTDEDTFGGSDVSGTEGFIGFVAPVGRSIARVELQNRAAGTDFIAYDLLTVGDAAPTNQTPEPGSLILGAIGLAALGRRRIQA